MDIASPFISPIFELLIKPIGRQFGYLFRYKSNIADLDIQVKNLVDMQSGVQERVQIARRNLENIDQTVKTWLDNVNRMKEETGAILEDRDRVDKGCLRGWFPNLKGGYVLSRKSKKKMQTVQQLQNEGKSYVTFSHDPLPLETSSFVPMNGFGSRKRIEEKIMSSLRDDNFRTIGICGMGGVGKTTMAKIISQRAKVEGIIDEVAMPVLSQQPNLGDIQTEIAERLGLKFTQESLSLRANRLFTRLMDGNRKLIILDDVWERLDLEKVGIPSQSAHSRCKLVLTSRNRDVCATMEANPIFTVQGLYKEEAWSLFKEKAGQSVDDPDLRSIARDVANECKGLPIALITVGRALKDRDMPFWEDALVQLKGSNPTNLTGLLSDVFRPLKLSYTYLESNEIRYLFLICTLFKEDVNIPLEDITRYGVGLSMFNGINNLEEARNRVHTLVEILKDRFLLVESDKERHVKMHDVVRDVGKFIASTENGFMASHDQSLIEWPSNENYTCISVQLGSTVSFPEVLNCPRLQLLLLGDRKRSYYGHYDSNYSIYYPLDHFFLRMSTLRVLELENMRLSPLPSSLASLENLRTLHLHKCNLRDVSHIGDLKSLEVLSFCYSTLRKLPAQIGNLCNLRLLALTYLRDVMSLNIERGAISRLSRLEELHMLNKFRVLDEHSVKELEGLVNLKGLQINIPDPREIHNNELGFPSNLRRFAISVGETVLNYRNFMDSDNYLSLDFPAKHVSLGRWVRFLLKHTKCLSLKGEGSADAMSELGPLEFKHLKVVEIKECEQLENLQPVKLKAAGESGSFSNLRSISVERCDGLRYLFPLSVTRNLLQLHQLKVTACGEMTSVFFEENTESVNATTSKIILPNLRELKLHRLKKLSCFCNGIDSIVLPRLNSLDISSFSLDGCSDHNFAKFGFPINLEAAIVGELEVHLSGYHIGSGMERLFTCFFINLRSLQITNCSITWKSLFPPLAAEGLVNLGHLTIFSVCGMNEVIGEGENSEENCITPKTVFPKLVSLCLITAKELRSFWPTKQSWEFPSLERVYINGCVNMETFTGGCLKTPRLTFFSLDHLRVQDFDVNGAIQHKWQIQNKEKEKDADVTDT